MAPNRFVYDFDEPSEGGRDLLGGKGIGLAEMTQLGVPVPAGFTITTDACRAYTENGGQLPDGLEAEVERHLTSLEEKSGKRFGDPGDPLLVSVRSGAAVSMPGMMDTILNLGLNDDAVRGLAERTGNPRFANDSYRRLIQMYGEVVDGVDGHLFEEALSKLKDERGAALDVDLSAEDMARLVETFKAIYESETGSGFPQDAREQLSRAVRAVFDSWDNPRAQVYRRAHHIPDDLGTAVNVVQMVFGNKGDQSGTGVAFTRDPSTGEPGLYGEFLADAQGEDVVAGIRTPEPLAEMKEALPEAFEQFVGTMQRLEEHYRDMQDIEFTVEDGRLYLLQTRSAKRTAAAALKSAVDMVDGGPDLARGRRRPHRPRTARPAPAPDDRPLGERRGRRAGAERLAGRRLGEDRLRRRHRGRAREERRQRDPRPLGDDPGRHPRDDRGAGDPDRPRWHDLARGGRCARDGQAVRGRLRGAHGRHGGEDCGARRPPARRGRRDHDRRRHGPRDARPRRARPAADQRGLRDDPRLGRRHAAPEGARERGHARGRGQGARVRRPGHRPLPHRAHVHGGGPAPGRPRDDHGLERGRAAPRARQAAPAPAGGLRGHLRGDGGPARHDPPARPAAARVPAAARGGDRRADARADPGAAARRTRCSGRAAAASG